MGLSESVQAYLRHLTQRNCTRATQRSARDQLKLLVSYLQAHELTDLRAISPTDVAAYRHAMQSGHPPFRRPLSQATVASYGSCLRCFFRFLEDEEVIFVDPTQHVFFPPSPKAAKPVLSESEIELLLSLPDRESPVGIRDRAILELFYAAGIRHGEAVALNVGDLDFAENLLWVRKGKGGKDRVVPIGKVAKEWLRQYLECARPKLLKQHPQEALWISANSGRRLAAAHLGHIVWRYGKRTGIRKPISAHTFRRTCASHMLAGGADARYVQELLGHRSLATTQLYLQWDLQQLKCAHRKFHPRERKKI